MDRVTEFPFTDTVPVTNAIADLVVEFAGGEVRKKITTQAI